MKCPRCQQDAPPDAEFCPACGTKLAAVCTQCGTANASGHNFCKKCGQPLNSAAGARPVGQRFASPEGYTPRHLAEKILTSKAALEGERKQVTVLFADLKGSMELLADRDPEEARKILDPVLELMMEAVHRFEGTVNQVMGDGIMALFGAPLAHEDHAVRGCYAALRMQESVKQYAEKVFRSHGMPIQIRLGLNSGEVVVRAIGSDLHMDYTAVGQTTHLAARMEQLATPGTILLAPATLQLAEGYVQVAARGPVAVKGLPDPLEIYELTGASALRSRLQATAARGFTRFVGRDPEIEQLRRALALAHDAHGQLIAVVGEPGVGKSRLVYEFTHSHRTQDWLILEAGSVSYGKATSYLPVIDLLKTYFKVHDRETHREIREKVTGKLLTLDRTLEPILPALLALLDVPVEDAQWHALDPPQRRQRTLDAVKHLLLRESQAQPVLVVFEDLHWIDSETQALLDSLVESLPSARLLLLVNYRPEYQHGWGSKSYYSQLRLDALPPESAGELLSALLGDDPELEPLKRLLVKRGNPFFIEESIRTLVETHALTRESGAYRLTRPIETIEVPATVQVILTARIDRLPVDDKQLLQMASVIGKNVPFVLLHAVAEMAEEEVHRGLTHLQAAEFLYETSLFPDPEYTFKHALTHEVTYGTLLQERRKALHARIVGAIEGCYVNRLTEHVERLAHHAVRGGVWKEAVPYLDQAGAKAFARSANREAVAWFDQALSALSHIDETAATIEKAVDLRFDLRNALLPLGEIPRLLEVLAEADRLAERLHDPRRAGWISAYTAVQLSHMGRPERAIESGRRALRIAEAAQDRALEIAAKFYLGFATYNRGAYRDSLAFLEDLIGSIGPDEFQEHFGIAGPAAVFARIFAVTTLAELGAFAEAQVHADELLRLAEAINQPYSLGYTYFAIGTLHLRMGNFELAIRVLERGLPVAQNFTFPWVAYCLGHAYTACGRVAEGCSLLDQAVRQAESVQLFAHHSLRFAYLGQARLRAGCLGEARDLTQRALDLAREHGERGHEARVLWLLGEVECEPGLDPLRAAECYREALDTAASLDMRPLVAHCHLGLGKLLQRTGKRQEAQEHLTTATAMFREMDMRFWLEQAETEMRGVV
jgi:class 3 adenylate cyclase/tetratricopeptide (TPR) repeat protein